MAALAREGFSHDRCKACSLWRLPPACIAGRHVRVARASQYLVFTMPGFAGFLAKVGLPPALAWPIVLAELIGGLAIIAGFYGRWISLALLPVLLGALSVHW